MGLRKGYWKGKHRSEETKGRISETLKGRKLSEETKKKLSEAHKGKPVWTEGKHLTTEHKKKISEAQKRNPYWKGKHHSEETRKKLSEAHKGNRSGMEGKHHSEETKRKLSKINRENPVRYWLGKHISKETKRKISESSKGAKGHNWKGGVSEAYQKHRAERDWKKSSAKIFKRDGYQCQLCGKKSRRLHAHHIIPWRVEYNDKMSNLITLCDKCHPKVESKWYQYAPVFLEMLGIYSKSNEGNLFE